MMRGLRRIRVLLRLSFRQPTERSDCLTVLACSVALLCSAHAQMQTAERTQIPSGPYRIAGTVVNAKAGSPLARCRVTIASVKNRQSMQFAITGDDGRFEFHVPAGKYSLQGEKHGFITALYNQHDQFSTAIVAGADIDSENLALRLAPNAAIAGQVLDEFGEPVRHAQVALYREEHSEGVSRTIRIRSASTDDQGRYELTPLDEGTYFVSAKASPWYAVHLTSNGGGVASQVDSSLDVAYPITYYGDVTAAEDSTLIPVRGGDRLEADIHLSPVPSVHLVVHVPDAGPHAATLPVLLKPAFDGLEPVESGFQPIAPGVFELSGVAAGRYTIQMPDSSGHSKEAGEIDLNSSGALDLSSGNSTSKIKATVKIAGAASAPADLQIRLRNARGKEYAAPVDAKGEANFPDVIPGKYDVEAVSTAQTYSVVRIATEAGTISGHSLNVPPGASLNLALSLVGGLVTVEGYAKRAGKGVAGVMVVLVPKNPEANRDRIRRAESDSDGSFSLPNVIPGSYTVVAIENGWDMDWAEPAVLAAYLQHGQTFEVGDRSQQTMRLNGAVEVQSR